MNGSTLTDENVQAFVGVLDGLSDGALCRSSLNIVTKPATVTPSGDHLKGYRGTVILEEAAGDLRVSITIPAISQSAIEPEDGKLTATAVASVKSAFEALTGKTMVYVDSFTYDKER